MRTSQHLPASVQTIPLPWHDWTGKERGVRRGMIIHLIFKSSWAKKKSITMIMTQGSDRNFRWATKYQIKYFKEGKWVTYQKADGTLVSVKLLR